jgi:hypothetical protein
MRSPLILPILILLPILAACPGNLDPIATFDQREANPLAFTSVDVHGRTVDVARGSQSVQIMFFSGERTSDAMQPVTADIAVHFREADDLEFVTIVDLRSLAFYEMPFADGAIRDAGERTIGRVNRQLRRDGLEEIQYDAMFDRLFMIADERGDITTAYGVPDPNEVLTCIVLDHEGLEVGRFNPSTQMEAVIAAIEEAR